MQPDPKPLETQHVATLPCLDIHTLSEDWALAFAAQQHWALLAESLGLVPSQWFDLAGDRMYGAVVHLTTWFDLDNPITEDVAFSTETALLAIRKPHSLSRMQVKVDGALRAEIRLLISFVKRREDGSNKKLSKVRDMWTAPEKNAALIEDLLATHHRVKSGADTGGVRSEYEINRIQDFNAAGLLYFKNFVRIAKAAEWRENRHAAPVLNAHRACYYYGNADDGERLSTTVHRAGDSVHTSHFDGEGQRIFISVASTRPLPV